VKAGFGKVVFVIRRDFEEAFKEKIAAHWEGKVNMAFAYQDMDKYVPKVKGQVERQKPWGTAHAILVAKEAVREPFVAINADDYYGDSGFFKMKKFLSGTCKPDHYGMVGYILRNTLSEYGAVSRGVCSMDSQNRLMNVTECVGIQSEGDNIFYPGEDGELKHLSGSELVSMNFWGFHPDVFDRLDSGFTRFVKQNKTNPKAEFYISTYANHLIETGAAVFSVLPNDEKWYGVTYQGDKPIVQQAFREMTAAEKYPPSLW
jgi:dTDP-glucose pyrophosphorylase